MDYVGSMMRALYKFSREPSPLDWDNPESYRCFLIHLLNPILLSTEKHHLTVEAFFKKMGRIPIENFEQVLLKWISCLEEKQFCQLISLFQNYISYMVARENNNISRCLNAVSFLKQLCELSRKKKKVGESLFYNEAVSSFINLKQTYREWLSSQNSRVFNWFNFPFLFTPLAKSKMVYIDAGYFSLFSFSFSLFSH